MATIGFGNYKQSNTMYFFIQQLPENPSLAMFSKFPMTVFACQQISMDFHEKFVINAGFLKSSVRFTNIRTNLGRYFPSFYSTSIRLSS
jgi:hypothetical protein